MRILFAALVYILIVPLISPAYAAIEITSSDGGLTLDVLAYNETLYDETHVWLGDPLGSATVPGADLTASGGLTYHGLAAVGDALSISAAGFLEVQGEVSENGAGFMAWDVPPNAWLIVGFTTSSAYAYDLTSLIENENSFSSASMRFVEGYYYGGGLNPSGFLPAGEYSLIFESVMEMNASDPGVYHSRQDWGFDLRLSPVVSQQQQAAVPESDSLLVWAIVAIAGTSALLTRRWRVPVQFMAREAVP